MTDIRSRHNKIEGIQLSDVPTVDRLRICKVVGMQLPVGTPITFQGNKIGQATSNSEIAINSDVAYSLIRGNKAQFSLEVVSK